MEGIMDDAGERREHVDCENGVRNCVCYDVKMRVVNGSSWTLSPRSSLETYRLFENTVKTQSIQKHIN
jgi:hypothetical protein